MKNEFFPKKRCPPWMVSEITTWLNLKLTTSLSVSLAYCLLHPTPGLFSAISPRECLFHRQERENKEIPKPILLLSSYTVETFCRKRVKLSLRLRILNQLWSWWSGFSFCDRLMLDMGAWHDDENKHRFLKNANPPTSSSAPTSFHFTLLRF